MSCYVMWCDVTFYVMSCYVMWRTILSSYVTWCDVMPCYVLFRSQGYLSVHIIAPIICAVWCCAEDILLRRSLLWYITHLTHRTHLTCVLQECWKGVTSVTQVLEGCYKSVTKVLRECYEGVTNTTAYLFLMCCVDTTSRGQRAESREEWATRGDEGKQRLKKTEELPICPSLYFFTIL
jgi:hypothetical protein